MSYTIDFTNLNALVTGGTRGIGRAISMRIAEAGAQVGMIYRSDETAAMEMISSLGGEHFTYRADLADVAAAELAGRECVAKLGGSLDLLVLNAASGGGGAVDAASDDVWTQAFGVNIHGHAALIRAVSPLMRSGGSVVFISSGAGHDPLPGLGPYGASKAAVNHMAKVLAQEWGPRGIRVNVVSPGHTAKGPIDYDNLSPGERETVNGTALRRIGGTDDVAKTVLYFLSDMASFVTGEVIRCNGGRV